MSSNHTIVFFDDVVLRRDVGQSWIVSGVTSHHTMLQAELAAGGGVVTTSPVTMFAHNTETGGLAILTRNSMYIQRTKQKERGDVKTKQEPVAAPTGQAA